MPPVDSPAGLHWKPGVPTTGLQLISTGHSLVDEYMASSAADYVRLFQLTGDRHDLDVAHILCHNTKSMLAMPGRTYDLKAPGWQQEHWSLRLLGGAACTGAGFPGLRPASSTASSGSWILTRPSRTRCWTVRRNREFPGEFKIISTRERTRE